MTKNSFIDLAQDKYKGKVIHSEAYKNSAGYEGKKVLVVGSGNSGTGSFPLKAVKILTAISGHDISSDLARKNIG